MQMDALGWVVTAVAILLTRISKAGLGGALGGLAVPFMSMWISPRDAVAVVLQHKKASISLVQRHLRIGYNRAARLLEQMEKSGLVSSMATNGNRELIVPARGGDGGATSAPWDEA